MKAGDAVTQDVNAGGTTKQPGLQGTKIFGVLLIPASLVAAYFWILEPVRDGVRTGEMQYNIKGLLLPPVLLYLGAAMLVTDMRDGQIRVVDADGKKRWTPRGRKFLAGLVAVIAVTLVAWYFYLQSIGFAMF